MDAERARALLLSLPHVAETVQWGGRLVFWVGDKTLGGRMFVIFDLEATGDQVAAFAAGRERQAEFVEREGLRPAPYLARAGWVAAAYWQALADRQWLEVFRAAHAHVLARLPRRTHVLLALPLREQQAEIAARKRAAARKAALTTTKP